MDAQSYFEGKKITVMGLGLLGRGVGDVEYLAQIGADVLVTDLKPESELRSSLERLQKFSNITYTLGEHRLVDFIHRDLILKAAGVPLDSPYIAEAKKNNIPIKMSASLFAEIAKIPVIGITGTRGKSTTTHMLHAILKEAGMKVLLGGNVRGVSTLAQLPEVTEDSVALMELDSWQLQGFGESKISPHVAVFTTFLHDHMNYYHNDLNLYLADKANIFLFQNVNDFLLLGSQCAELIQEKYGDVIHSKKNVVGAEDLPVQWTLQVPGEHNRYDAALACKAAQILGVSDISIKIALENFVGVAGRLEFVRTVDGVDYYNDTTATTPDATLAALTALGEKYNNQVLLIMGGADKTLDMSTLLEKIPLLSKQVILLAGSGTDRIRKNLPRAEVYDNLAIAIGTARGHAQPGDVVVLSPAFASFGMFTNEYDRGDQFDHAVKSL
jgi:UDP-N-acetylmuramoylalanine--D-glutamate ligase